jgi:hypothetical protein
MLLVISITDSKHTFWEKEKIEAVDIYTLQR